MDNTRSYLSPERTPKSQLILNPHFELKFDYKNRTPRDQILETKLNRLASFSDIVSDLSDFHWDVPRIGFIILHYF